MKCSGMTAVVLGASAAGGSGHAVAKLLAQEGAKVVVAARSEAPLRQLAEEIGGLAVVCDGSSVDDVERLGAAAQDWLGEIDIAVSAAGSTVPGMIGTLGLDDLRVAMELNFYPHFNFLKALAPKMRDGGAITLFSSSSASQVVEPFVAYACAKAAGDCLVRYAAMELGPRGIRVNSILPGLIRSAMAAEVLAIEGVEEAYLREIPLNRVGTPEDFARTVLWLSTDAFMTGVNLPVSGGAQLTRPPRYDEVPATIRWR